MLKQFNYPFLFNPNSDNKNTISSLHELRKKLLNSNQTHLLKAFDIRKTDPSFIKEISKLDLNFIDSFQKGFKN